MDADERERLRAAANEVLSAPSTGAAWAAEPGRLIPAARVTARGVLALLGPADDGKPTDEAWPRETLPNVGKPLQPLEPYSSIYRTNGRWWMTLSLPRGTTVSCQVPAARGSVRALLAALTPEPT